MLPVGKKINDLKKEIEKLNSDLLEIKKQESPKPEFINTTNMLRTNEFLSREVEQQKQLVTLYQKYSKELEGLILSAASSKSQIKELKSKTRAKKSSIRKTKRKTKQKTKSKVRRKIKLRKRKIRKKRR